MKALMKVAKGYGNIEIREVEIPEIIRDDDVLIKVKAAGVCGTDIHIYHDKFTSYPPVIMGHEFSGIVVETGKSVRKWNKGDRVVGEPHTMACGVCNLCRQGKVQICAEKRSPGWGINGAFTDYLIMPEKLLHKVPDILSDDVAALAEPMAIVTHQVLERGRVEPQDFVAVIGAGPIGLLSAFAAKEGGASKVAVLGLSCDRELRFKVAEKLGIDYTINVQEENALDRIMALTGGKGADLVVEASGAEAGINTAMDVVKKCGRITAVGVSGKERIGFQWDKAINKVCDIFFNLSSSYISWDRGLSIMANSKVDLSPIITHKELIDDWQQAFENIQNGRAVKVMFIPASEI